MEMTQSGTRHRWRVLNMTFLAYLYDSLDLQILAICMPVIIASLGISLTDAGLLASATMIGTAIGGVLFGWVAENWGRKNAAVICLIEFGIFTALVYWVTSWEQLMVLRFLQGVGMGGLWGPIVALIADHWAPRYRARAAGFMLSTFALGGILASLMGRYLLDDLGWHMLFALTGSAAIVGVLFWLIVPADPPRTAKAHKDGVSFKRLFAPGTAMLTIGATIAAACQMGGFWGVSSWIPTYLVQVRGLDLSYMSLFSVVIFSGAFVGYFLFAWIADRIGRRNALMLAFLADTIIVPLYVIVPDAELLFWLGPLMGLSFGGVFGLFGSYFAELFPQDIRAMGSGFAFNIGRGIGAVVTPVTVGAMAKTHGLAFGIGACSVVFFVGAITVWLMPETLKREEVLGVSPSREVA
ncbi:MFS transporter [Shinella zoogloeoides]|uniref:MFS transporter n=1 Tax=Shinella zoogloeoides TaxID=352475 RepID=UPI000E65CDF1|nr:MFS transporter [Shinella zoogloeoides]